MAAPIRSDWLKIESAPETALGYRDNAAPIAFRVSCASGRSSAIPPLTLSILLGAVALAVPGAPTELRLQLPGLFWLALTGLTLASLALAYASAAIGLNRTTIAMAPRGITVERGPLPWPGRSLRLPLENVLNFAVEGREPEGRAFESRSFAVVARTTEGDVTIVHGVPDVADALAAVDALMRYLRSLQPTERLGPAQAGGAAGVRAAAARRFARAIGQP